MCSDILLFHKPLLCITNYYSACHKRFLDHRARPHADTYLLVHREPGLGALTHRRNAQQRLPKLLIFLVYCRVQWR